MNREHTQRVLNHISQHQFVAARRRFSRSLNAMKRKDGQRIRAQMLGKQVFIWSCEHMAWWRPERSGYTIHIEAAGVYSFEEAWSATFHCGPEKKIVFYPVMQSRKTA